jgi:hypothetical protein
MNYFLSLLGVCAISFSLMNHSSAQPIDFERVGTLVKATKEETIWKNKIDWQTDLWKARQMAAKQGKPIFIWEMDGHPMGCT